MVTLHQGDRFEVGSVKGTVTEIGENDFCFDFEGKRKKLSRGELLDQAKPVSDAPQAASTAPTPASGAEVKSVPGDKAS
jgi:hypothetical protein